MGADRENINWYLHNMKTGLNAAGSEPDPIVIYRGDAGIIICCGDTVPSGAGYAPGCSFIHTDGSSSDYLYVNNGTATTADFEKTIDANNILAAIQGEHLSGTAAGVGPSPLIWDDTPVLEVMLDPSKGIYHFEDFLKPDVYATTVLNAGLLFTQQNGAGTVANNPAVEGGVLLMDTGSVAANDGPSVQFPGIQCAPAPGTTIYFEARLKVDNDQGDIFVGLCDCASVTSVLGTGTIITNKDHAGFFRDDGVTDCKLGAQTCDATNTTTEDNVIADIDKDAYNKYGVVISGDGDTALDTVKFYINGVLIKTVTDTDGGGDDGVPDKVIAPLFEVHAHGAGSIKMSIDWMRVLVYNATDGTARV